MTEKTFGERWVEGRGASFEFRGSTVHAAHKVRFTAESVLTVRFISCSKRARQALRAAVDRGVLVVNGQELRDVILWRDTAPDVVPIRVAPKRGACVVTLWNAWEDERGSMQAWIGNGGMVIRQDGDVMRLECSAGVGEPDFRDLVVEVRVAPVSG